MEACEFWSTACRFWVEDDVVDGGAAVGGLEEAVGRVWVDAGVPAE
jgi:hypothetical protein